MVYHPKHHHWHVEGFAAYRLYPVDATGNVNPTPVATSSKVSFCMLDMEQVPNFPITTKQYTTCGANATMGISVGWADDYYSGLADQWIVLPTNLATGIYCLVNIGNIAAVEYVRNQSGAPLPGLIEGVVNHTHESNAKGVQISLSNGGSTVAPTTTPCLPTEWPSERT